MVKRRIIELNKIIAKEFSSFKNTKGIYLFELIEYNRIVAQILNLQNRLILIKKKSKKAVTLFQERGNKFFNLKIIDKKLHSITGLVIVVQVCISGSVTENVGSNRFHAKQLVVVYHRLLSYVYERVRVHVVTWVLVSHVEHHIIRIVWIYQILEIIVVQFGAEYFGVISDIGIQIIFKVVL
ncbi:hypothetical protein BpHYR1_000657 [Brachionus plicatilis]|uniref:Uncharacterized protein n=1 Tax=Brachionus plicatilis TaxID=10195 RepID=A0A3M7SGV4_BRAPC|nr:hypothetical protein BpHYR1_000657 [Brachionus plicatilis]